METNIRRQMYFDVTIHKKAIKDCISGKNENKVIKLLQSSGYKLGKDFVRQHPIGSRFVLDFAFVKEQFAIEVDGDDHRHIKQKKIDRLRDTFLYNNNWVVLRILDKKFNDFFGSYYKHLIQEVVEERREQYESGKLYNIFIPDFNQQNYE